MSEEFEGKAKGGKARAEALTPEKRREIAKKAAEARWAKDVVEATHGSADHPLKIGDIEIPCYVLADETRVLSQRGMVAGMGMAQGSASGGADRLTSFFSGKRIFSYINKDLMAVITNPIKFRSPQGGGVVYGYPATILADICEAVLEARKNGALQKQQEHIAHQCEILIRGFARTGIIALIDEATGYQKDRARDALAKILEDFIEKELQPWVRTFPPDFYAEMFRLRGLPYPPDSVKRPQYFGLLTNNVVYDRLAPGVKKELQRGIPRNEAGRPTAKYFQKLTRNTGYPKLREHLGSVITLMKLSDDWDDFIKKMDKFHPKYGETLEMDV
ncbi:MAG: P63C domain-containing protein [Candidatus Thiodiazotropha sp.]